MSDVYRKLFILLHIYIGIAFHHTHSITTGPGHTPLPGSHLMILMVLNRTLLRRPFLLALAPALAVVFDYGMTLAHSGGRAAILAFEYSPILKTAVETGLILPCIAALALGYYVLGFIALASLEGTRYYLPGALLILLISLTHVSGGLSWVIRNPAYADAVLVLAAAGVIFALSVFLFAVKRHRTEAAAAL